MSGFHSHSKCCVKNNWLQDEPSFPQERNSKNRVRDSTYIKEPGLDSQDGLNLSYNCIYCGSKMRCLNKVFPFGGWKPSAYPPKKRKNPNCTCFSDVLVMELDFKPVPIIENQRAACSCDPHMHLHINPSVWTPCVGRSFIKIEWGKVKPW